MMLTDFLNPKNFWERLSTIVRNYRNLSFYKKTMRRLQADGSLSQLGMRLDSRCRAYYVLNLEPETLMIGSDVLELERSRVYDSLGQKKAVLEAAGLIELIEAKTDRIKTSDYYAYLIQIKYRPLTGWTDLALAFSWLAILALLTYEAIHLGQNWSSFTDWGITFLNKK